MEDVVEYVFHGTWPSRPVKRKVRNIGTIQLKIADGWIAMDTDEKWFWHTNKPSIYADKVWLSGSKTEFVTNIVSNLPAVPWTESCFEVKDGCIRF